MRVKREEKKSGNSFFELEDFDVCVCLFVCFVCVCVCVCVCVFIIGSLFFFPLTFQTRGNVNTDVPGVYVITYIGRSFKAVDVFI